MGYLDQMLHTYLFHWYAKWWRGFAEHYFGRSRSFSENS